MLGNGWYDFCTVAFLCEMCRYPFSGLSTEKAVKYGWHYGNPEVHGLKEQQTHVITVNVAHDLLIQLISCLLRLGFVMYG